MKGLILPNRELRVLSAQLQNFKQGYTVAEIRVLDKVVKNLGLTLAPFNLELQAAFDADPKDQEKTEKAVKELMEGKGKETVTTVLEDEDFEFVKYMWGRMAGMSGSADVREMVMAIDDAIKTADNQVFNKVIN